MSKENFESLLAEDFKATAHFDFNIIIETLRQAMLKGIVDPLIVDKIDHENDDGTIWVEKNEILLSPPVIELVLLEDQEIVPVPEGLTIKDENGNEIPLEDVDPPVDREQQDVLFEIQVPFHLQTNNADLASVDVEEITGTLIMVALPYFSPSVGVGVIRYDFNLEITSTGPSNIKIINDNVIRPGLLNKFYPKIIELIEKAKFQLPDIDGLSVRAMKLFPHFNEIQPATLSIGLGGTAGAEQLLPLLDGGDGVTISVSKSLFEEKVENFSSNLPEKSYNWDDERWETLHHVKLKLGNGHVDLDTKITVHGRGIVPDATICIEGPIRFDFEVDGVDSKLKGDGKDLDVDLPAWLDFIRGLTDVLTLGFAEFGWTGFYEDSENEARGGATKTVANTLNRALLGAFPSGMELFGKNMFMTRESAVPWGTPNTIVIKKEGLMIGGPGFGGIKYELRKLNLDAVYRPSGTIRSYGFENEFYLSKARTIELWTRKKIYIPGVMVGRRGAKYFLKDIPDKRKADNLSEKPTFSIHSTSLENADHFEPEDTSKKYAFNDSEELVMMNP
ncbi:hypothetical protein JMN32_21420 [Fulvivirga sp. 29W222]|uniref:Uncharacterized protein n=1 Tax=Fulvivirga marina TaxID=2494733 RepID=A0A937G5N6_9BACT|nr:DUF3892 domain-containing protein [Fulvivirga marina]MBL6448886.1 hypothetical protein [Fulvivirga marina]